MGSPLPNPARGAGDFGVSLSDYLRRRPSVFRSDVSLERLGWRARYTRAPAGTRSLPTLNPQADWLAPVWIAQSEQGHAAASTTARVVAGAIRKILQRGATPPLSPHLENRFLDDAGLLEFTDPSPLPGDLSRRPKPSKAPPVPEIGWFRASADATLDAAVALDSDFEDVFLRHVLPEILGPEVLRWVLPQAPISRLTADGGALDARRVDFLIAAPWLPQPIVVEIDDESHAEQEANDAARDADLRDHGFQVVRIPNVEVVSKDGPGLSKLRAAWRELPEGDEAAGRLLQRLASTARIALALTDALDAGFLHGPEWCLQILDPEGVGPAALPAFLDLLLAVDSILGGEVAPARVTLRGLETVTFQVSDRRYVRAESVGRPPRPMLKISLEPMLGPLHALPPTGDLPQIVVRSANVAAVVEDEAVEDAAPSRPPMGPHLEDAITVVLQWVFAKESLWPGQLQAITRLLSGRDTAVLLPTGAGKSLVYQVVGLLMPGRTLVIDPIISLMEDQVLGLRAHGIDRAVTISHALDDSGLLEAMQALRSGTALFTFVAPERLQIASFRKTLAELSMRSRVNLAVVDEAHCVSEWGHDFRTAYLNLGRVIRQTCRDSRRESPAILALTGTASRAVLKDVLIELGIDQSEEGVVIRPESLDRPELHFKVVESPGNDAKAALRGLLPSLPGLLGQQVPGFFDASGLRTNSGIIFAPHTNGDHGVNEVAEALAPALGVNPVVYSGKAPRGRGGNWDLAKRRNAEAFRTNAVAVLIATNAYGMGIDKPNIRWIAHYGIPGSIEAYYQEAGRAGRDKREAVCLLVVNTWNESRARNLLADELPLDDAHARYKSSTSWKNSDDVDRQLYFLFDSFPGIESEMSELRRTLHIIEGVGEFGQKDIAQGEDRDARERALHRLVVLGVLDEYLVDFGGRRFTVRTRQIDRQDVLEAVVAYAQRNQPARARALREQLAALVLESSSLDAAILACGRVLIEFIYDVIARSRRRALAEMWLAALDAARSANSDEVLRNRILSFLTQGEIARELERRLETPAFSYGEWFDLIDLLGGEIDVLEARGASARLLASAPDHPGLLLLRAFADLWTVQNSLTEFGLDVERSLSAAVSRYGCSASDAVGAARWILSQSRAVSPSGFLVALEAIRRSGAAQEVVQEALQDALSAEASPAESVLGLAHRMTQCVELLGALLESEVPKSR